VGGGEKRDSSSKPLYVRLRSKPLCFRSREREVRDGDVLFCNMLFVAAAQRGREVKEGDMQQKQDSQGGKPSSILGKVGRIASVVCVCYCQSGCVFMLCCCAVASTCF
jgi:hypothetical protein